MSKITSNISCALIENYYIISYKGNLDSLDKTKIYFEDDVLRIDKQNLSSYLIYTDNFQNDINMNLRIHEDDFITSIIHIKNKSKIRDRVINRFTQSQLSAVFFKKHFFPNTYVLKDYQKFGIEWLQGSPGRLLADDMGLGKTAQALVAATNLIKKNKIKRVLIVCPSSLMQNWSDELNIWAQSFKGYQVSSSTNTNILWKGIIKHGHFFIVNYDQLRTISDVFSENPPDLIICDEAHKLRKKTSLIHKGLKKLSSISSRFWALTGTPIEKNTDDLISLMQLVSPNSFNSTSRKLSPIAIKGMVKINFLRRLKSSVLEDLTDINERNIYLDLTEIQKKEYARVKKKMLINSGKDILKNFNQLRVICDEFNGSSIKYDYALELIEKIKYKNEKVIIFSYTIEPLRSLRSLIKKYFGTKSALIYEGSMDLEERNKAISSFKSREELFILLCSGKIAGEGLNLTEANNVIFLNEWWNPSSNNQARDRVHRIGQTHDVTVYNLRTKGTVEEVLTDILKDKKDITLEVIEGMISKEFIK